MGGDAVPHTWGTLWGCGQAIAIDVASCLGLWVLSVWGGHWCTVRDGPPPFQHKAGQKAAASQGSACCGDSLVSNEAELPVALFSMPTPNSEPFAVPLQEAMGTGRRYSPVRPALPIGEGLEAAVLPGSPAPK